MMADYSRYFGPVEPSMPWPLFLAFVRRVDRYEARNQLTMFDAVRSAIGAALGGEDKVGALDAARKQMAETAYPIRFERQVILNGRGSHG